MDSNQWTTHVEEINGGLRVAMGEIATSSACSRQQQQAGMAAERKARPQKDQVLNCPRCHSTNTKFCYYNNYSLTQPRYFCKSCRRYWTEGGTLRNVPVGGGSRKNKRSTAATSASSHKLPDLNPPSEFPSAGNPNKIIMMNEGQDLNLGFPGSQHHHLYHFELPKFTDNNSSSHNQLKSPTSSAAAAAAATPFAALELLRTELASRGMNSNFITSGSSTSAPDTNAIYSNTSGFSFQELKPGAGAVTFSVDHGLGSSRYVVDPRGGMQENGGRLMFPFGGMKQAAQPPSNTHDQAGHQDNSTRGPLSNSNGFWNGMLGGGGSW